MHIPGAIIAETTPEVINMANELGPQENIEDLILMIRGQKVMIDRDLARWFMVETKYLNRQVKRNRERFPDEFIFQLTEQEKAEVVTNWHHLSELRFSHQLPYVFTEHGIAMLSTVLKSDIAVKMSIFIIKAFIALRKHRAEHSDILGRIDKVEARVFKHDENIRDLVRDIRKLTIDKSTTKHNVGFLK